MFDIGWQELFIVAILAIIVVGPRDLPRTMRTIMSYVRKAKGMARDFQDGIDEVAREVELDDIRKEANKIAHMDLDKEIQETLDPTGSLNDSLDMSDVQSAIQDSANAMNSIEAPATSKETPNTIEAPNTIAPPATSNEALGDVSEASPETETSPPEPSPKATG